LVDVKFYCRVLFHAHYLIPMFHIYAKLEPVSAKPWKGTINLKIVNVGKTDLAKMSSRYPAKKL
jgi:hypothetical protein